MSSVRWIFAGVFFVSAGIQAFYVQDAFKQMFDAVNARLPRDQQIPPFPVGTRLFQIRSLYASVCPDSELKQRFDRLLAGFLFCFAMTAVLVLVH